MRKVVETQDLHLSLVEGNPLQKLKAVTETDKLIAGIKKYKPGSNANIEAIKNLEAGRYGPMDGKATDRAVELINNVKGEFCYRWPRPVRNYDQMHTVKETDSILVRRFCTCCRNEFYSLQPNWLDSFLKVCKAQEKLRMPVEFQCPHCASTIITKTAMLKNPRAYGLGVK